ncbi:MAG: hypothetical protein KKI08_01110, partial [Armatimonadetes bacterium]|nr:hypothetical protein [Armatimonadota bacterium]
RGNAFPRSVGATPYFQLLGGWILDADTRPTDMPVWYYRFPLWRPTTLAANPAATFRRREVNSMAWGDTEGKCCYAFGAEDYPGYHARIWKSTDYGLSWAPLPNLDLDGHRQATVRMVTSGNVVWGHTNSHLVCIPAYDPPRLIWYPEAHRNLLALCAPNETLVTVVIRDLLRADPQAYVFASRNGGTDWKGTKSVAGFVTAADFLVPDVGMLTIRETAPVRAARLLYTRDGWQTSQTDRIENGEVMDIKVVSDREIYLLVQERGSGKLYYGRWHPD